MANVPKVLKEKIARTNRKEASGASQVIGEMKPNLRSIVADLRRRVFVLERENKRLMAAINKFRVESAQKPDEKLQNQLTSNGIRSLRISQGGNRRIEKRL